MLLLVVHLQLLLGVTVSGYAINDPIMISSTKNVNIHGKKSLSFYDQKNSEENQKIDKNSDKQNKEENTKYKEGTLEVVLLCIMGGVGIASIILCPFLLGKILETYFLYVVAGGVVGGVYGAIEYNK